MVYSFDVKFDRFSGERKKNINLVDKLYLLNEAQLIFLEWKSRLFELNSEYRDILKPLEVKEYELKRKFSGDGYDVFEFPEDMYRSVREYVILRRDDCGKKRVPLIHVRSDKLEYFLKSPFWKPSYKWETVIGDEASDGIYVWYEDGCEIEKVVIDYIRYPAVMQAPSLREGGQYIDWNGKLVTNDVDCDFNDNDARKIVDIAVLLARSNMGDVRDFEVKLKELLTNIDVSSKV